MSKLLRYVLLKSELFQNNYLVLVQIFCPPNVSKCHLIVEKKQHKLLSMLKRSTKLFFDLIKDMNNLEARRLVRE